MYNMHHFYVITVFHMPTLGLQIFLPKDQHYVSFNFLKFQPISSLTEFNLRSHLNSI